MGGNEAQAGTDTGRIDLLRADRRLLRSFREGDPVALARVYRSFVDDVVTLIRRGFVVGPEARFVPGERDPEAQRDLAQEVFVRAFAERARLSFDGLRPYRPYLLRIAKNAMIDRARRSATRKEVDQGVGDIDQIASDDAAFAPEVAAPEEELGWKRLRTATVSFLAEQGQEVQDFVRLRFEEERSQAEVAEALGVSRRRVRTLEARVEARLRRHLRKERLLGT